MSGVIRDHRRLEEPLHRRPEREVRPGLPQGDEGLPAVVRLGHQGHSVIACLPRDGRHTKEEHSHSCSFVNFIQKTNICFSFPQEPFFLTPGSCWFSIHYRVYANLHRGQKMLKLIFDRVALMSSWCCHVHSLVLCCHVLRSAALLDCYVIVARQHAGVAMQRCSLLSGATHICISLV